MDLLETSHSDRTGCSATYDDAVSEQYFDVSDTFSNSDSADHEQCDTSANEPHSATPDMIPPPEISYRDLDTAKKSQQFGQYRDRLHDQSIRLRHNTGSRKTNCSFSVVVTESDGQWQVIIRDPEHNHDASIHAYAHPVHRRDYNHDASIHAYAHPVHRQLLRQIDADMSVTRRDVHNLRAEIKRKELNGPSPIQALLFQLDGLIH
ncbi:hypothetical protein V1525DRAFT_399436 [Lipomyces kononenkoae]|uniref:Uncharacterized protein n=1 Tax=Lipomyces kononenkoae TaxID=34357 RepID=A0ACC3T7W9_LIPKO